MRPVRGQTAFVRELRDDLAPMFGATPFTVAVYPEVFSLRADMRRVVIDWRGGQPAGKAYYWPAYRFTHPMLPSMVADPVLRRGLIARIGYMIWQQHLPHQRRMRRRVASA
jgi:hypothetical protein